jgi:hypothetical protein
MRLNLSFLGTITADLFPGQLSYDETYHEGLLTKAHIRTTSDLKDKEGPKFVVEGKVVKAVLDKTIPSTQKHILD